MIQVDYNDAEARKLLNELRDRMGNIEPVMDAVGQVYLSGVLQRFVDQKAPDGTPWKPLSPVTLDRRRKKGRGAQILRDTGRLMNSLSYKTSGNTVTVFTNVKYAGTHQYGFKKIPARPFLGINDADNDAVLEVMNGYLQANQPLSWWQALIRRFTRARP